MKVSNKFSKKSCCKNTIPIELQTVKVTSVKINCGFSLVGTVANIIKQITLPPKARHEYNFLK